MEEKHLVFWTNLCDLAKYLLQWTIKIIWPSFLRIYSFPNSASGTNFNFFIKMFQYLILPSIKQCLLLLNDKCINMNMHAYINVSICVCTYILWLYSYIRLWSIHAQISLDKHSILFSLNYVQTILFFLIKSVPKCEGTVINVSHIYSTYGFIFIRKC